MTNDDAAAKLKTLAFILKFNNDLFETRSFDDCAAMAVNESRALLNFRSAAIFSLDDKNNAVLLAQFAQNEPQQHSALAAAQKRFIEKINFHEDDTLIFDKNSELPPEMAKNNAVYLMCRLSQPKNIKNADSFIWLLEYENEVPQFAVNTAKLLGKSIVNALALHKISAAGNWKKHRSGFKKICSYLIAAIIFIAAMSIPVPETSNAEFTLISGNISAAYAWFDGNIAKCFKQDGDIVKKGDVIAIYDTAKLHYQLAMAKANLQELEAELSLVQQDAFTDESKLGKAELLKAKLKSLQIAVKEAQWFIDHSRITAPADGILTLTDSRAELLTGKAVKTGDKIFEILDQDSIVAEIPVNERDSSVLQDDFDISLFLHTAPETAIAAEPIETASYPALTMQQTFCYNVRAKITGTAPAELRFGMRGIAKITGRKVSLGYALFKSMILYFRNW